MNRARWRRGGRRGSARAKLRPSGSGQQQSGAQRKGLGAPWRGGLAEAPPARLLSPALLASTTRAERQDWPLATALQGEKGGSASPPRRSSAPLQLPPPPPPTLGFFAGSTWEKTVDKVPVLLSCLLLLLLLLCLAPLHPPTPCRGLFTLKEADNIMLFYFPEHPRNSSSKLFTASTHVGFGDGYWLSVPSRAHTLLPCRAQFPPPQESPQVGERSK